mgnify:CR=1 FL=1
MAAKREKAYAAIRFLPSTSIWTPLRRLPLSLRAYVSLLMLCRRRVPDAEMVCAPRQPEFWAVRRAQTAGLPGTCWLRGGSLWPLFVRSAASGTCALCFMSTTYEGT